LFEDGTISCAGWNTQGQVGISQSQNYMTEAFYFYDNFITPGTDRGVWDGMWAIEGATVARTTNDQVFYWGTVRIYKMKQKLLPGELNSSNLARQQYYRSHLLITPVATWMVKATEHVKRFRVTCTFFQRC
jgi:hypothetical protein